MTTDEIMKIAEEFLKEKYPKSLRDFGPHIINSMATYLLTIFEWLSEKYFIVEKSKVRDEYKYSKDSYNRTKGSNDYFEGYWEGKVDSCEDIFGTDVSKEE